MEDSESCTGLEVRNDLGDDVCFDACTNESEAASVSLHEERSPVPEVESQIPIDQLARLTGARPRTKPEKDAMRELELGMEHLRTGEAPEGNHTTSSGDYKASKGDHKTSNGNLKTFGNR